MQINIMKENLISIYDEEKWWMLDIDKCDSTNEC